ncbi:MAG TPA: DUF2721 domain-containing protein, partial [Polyangiaceae bacterium]|nr:DUF2721 domain-containing protein [Polyangiaceae bacterium]
MNELTSAGEVLAAMITPALLISATGTLVLSTSNRLSRVVDRVRVLARDAEQLVRPLDPSASDPGFAQAKRTLITSQLTALAHRALLLRSALAALYTAIGFLVATSIAVGAVTSFGSLVSWPVIALAMVGACALLWGSVLLVREGRQAIGSTLEEMQWVRQVVAGVPAADPTPLGTSEKSR